jgi:prolyl 4-hydroxylase
VTNAAAMPVLQAQWQDWLASSILEGKSDAEMVAKMVENHFDATYASVAISVVRSMTERVQANNPSAIGQFEPEQFRTPKPANCHLADCSVAIQAVLHNPNIVVLSGILSLDECRQLINLSEGKLQRSTVVEKHTGKLEISAVRLSDGCHFERGENSLIQALEARIAAFTGIPVEQGEPLQILRYNAGGEYLPHHDYFHHAETGSSQHLLRGGQRIATMVIYLSAVAQGGETYFPDLEFSVKPHPGSAVYFEYVNSSGQLDSRCLHAGLPVAQGDKWIATKWFRTRAY